MLLPPLRMRCASVEENGQAFDLPQLWIGERVLHDVATVQAAVAHRNALFPLRDRAHWIAMYCNGACSIREDPKVSNGIPCSVAKHSRVRFAWSSLVLIH